MTETSKSYRIRTEIGKDLNKDYITVNADLIQDYDTFEVLSVDIKSKDAYQLHNSNYGVVVGRVLANNGFGIPNAKISIFIEADINNGVDVGNIYPFNSSIGKDKDGVRYNLLPNDRVDGCHQVVGTFPTKRYALDNDVILEVFDHYYTYTTKTNNSGDYMICGVPTGSHTIHMDLDLSDCGILSQKPRDFVYKGYTIEQFETPTKFKGGTDYNNLSQIFTQDQVVNVNPFWGNSDLGETIGVSRCDIDVNFKFEPTCVFMGSIVSDNASNGFSKKCIPTDAMGYMDELVTGEGKIEMIRKTPGGAVEEFSIKGNKLINANGVWCYQIPMNLDYMVTDEYGNMVPTDNPEKGIPTRASVRFRMSMEDSEENTDNFFRAKVLVPNNPQVIDGTIEDYDYEFGSYTRDDSFRDLFWNNVYSVKSYIPRIQRSNSYKKEKFSGIKHCNKFGQNNPMPYNNIRIKLPLMFTIMCALIKAYIFIVSIINTVNVWIFNLLGGIVDLSTIGALDKIRAKLAHIVCGLRLIVLKDGLCPDLENWYFSPCSAKSEKYLIEGCTSTDVVQDAFKDEYIEMNNGIKFYRATDEPTAIQGCDNYNGGFYEIDASGIQHNKYLFWKINLLERTLASVDDGEFEEDDDVSIDATNDEDQGNEAICITTKTDYLIACIEMNLAQEYNVINFDFYNDWINGVIYNPRWVRFLKKKTRFLWITWAKEKIKGCMDDTKIYSTQRKYVQQCAFGYKKNTLNGYEIISKVDSPINTKNENYNGSGDTKVDNQIRKANNFHKKRGLKMSRVFKKGGISHETTTLKGQKVYYLKPCEFNDGKKTILYANDIILLGTFNDCDLNGIPKLFTHLVSTSYIMPTNLALTNMDTNGPLYAKDNGTVCLGQGAGANTDEIKELSTSGITIYRKKIYGQWVNKERGPLGSEMEYYGTSDEYSIQDKRIFGDSSTYGDTMAITEAAGISWNYTGPGQGEIIKDRMYYPGGHFLGISCVNSQTNLKSCINLSRICEIGANLSQRHEDVRAIGENGFKYTYTSPTGFISGDDIVDSDFRAMFATLNKKRLIATKRNKKTGYRIYDFEFVNPINFNGAFNDVVYGDYLHNNNEHKNDRPYNENVTVYEEDLTDFGIKKGVYRSDYDGQESANTQTRTREITSLDYYLFRLGLTYDEAYDVYSSKSKFLVSSDDTYFLPQYENSYYFYFGLKQGATALDEFNKQFYAECDEIKLKQKPNIILAVTVDFCNATGNIHIITEGLSAPYQEIYVEGDDGTPIHINAQNTSNQTDLQMLSMESFYFTYEGEPYDFQFGEYTVTVIDDDGVEVRKSIVVGNDLFRYDMSVVDFTKPISDGGLVGVRNIYQGGFAFIENFECRYDGNENVNFSFGLFFEGNPSGQYEYIDDFGHVVYGTLPYINYDLYVMWNCDGGDQHSTKLETIMFQDNRDVDLRLGYDDIHSISCVNEDLLRYMSDEFWWDDSYNISDSGHSTDYDRWFLRKMFFKESNLSTFDSHVYPVNGCRKVLWGTPQVRQSTMVNVGGYRHIYCSDRIFDLPNGTYLDDTRTITPTYGASECAVEEDEQLRSSTDNNCMFQYCAQAYNGTNVAGEYHGTYNRVDGVSLDNRYFHEKYGCVFKPLPYGNLIFLEYNNINDLKDEIEDKTNAKYGVIYPTFIYPVMKRPFYCNYSMMIFNKVDVDIQENSGDITFESKNKEYLNNALVGIHNGVTYNKRFNYIYIFSSDSWDENDVRSADTYNITLTSNTDRVFECNMYENTPDCLNDTIFYRLATFGVTEGYPSSSNCGYDASLLAKQVYVYENYNFYDNLYYRISGDINTSSEKIITVFGDGISDSGVSYFIGCYDKNSNNVQFLMEPDNGVEGKYAYSRDSHEDYIVLCRFIEDERVHETQWYTNVFVRIHIINSSELDVHYEYMNTYGVITSFDEQVLTTEGQELPITTHPYGINYLLDNITNGYGFERIIPNQMITVNEPFPFIPVKNNNVRNGNNSSTNYQPFVAYNRDYYGPEFKQFMQKLTTKGHLRPIEYCDTLQIGQVDNKQIFGIGVKTILSNEDNETTSYVYKIYQNPFRDRFFSDAGDYSLIIEPSFYSYYGNMYKFGKGKAYKDISIDVASYPCTVLISLENNGGWCYFDYGNESCHGSKEVGYAGSTIHIRLWVLSNNEEFDRNCKLTIQSYYGGLRDSVEIIIRQNGRSSSPKVVVNVTQDYPEQIDEQTFHDHQSYSYRLRISTQYLCGTTYTNYIKIRPDGFGGVTDNPYVSVFHNENYVPDEIVLEPNAPFEKTITVNDANVARYHVPFEMFENTSAVIDEDSDYIVSEIRYDYF